MFWREQIGDNQLGIRLIFVLMDVNHLSRFIHFDRDRGPDGYIPEHAALGFEFETLHTSRRRQRHLRLAIINRCECPGEEAVSSGSLPFRMGIHDQVALVDTEYPFITDFRGAMAVAKGLLFGQSEGGAGRRLDGIETGLQLRHNPLHLFMAGFHMSDIFRVRCVRLRVHRDHQHGRGYHEEREDRKYLAKHSVPPSFGWLLAAVVYYNQIIMHREKKRRQTRMSRGLNCEEVELCRPGKGC